MFQTWCEWQKDAECYNYEQNVTVCQKRGKKQPKEGRVCFDLRAEFWNRPIGTLGDDIYVELMAKK